MTLKMMDCFGVQATWQAGDLHIPHQAYQPCSFTVESDWSAASYWYEMLSLAPQGEVWLKGLIQNSFQGDSKVAEWFESLGVHTTFKSEGVLLTKNDTRCSFFEADLTDQPDLAQTMVVTCLLQEIPFHLKGLKSLRIKETDRITALIQESAKLGYLVTETDGPGLAWSGEHLTTLAAPVVDTYEDHRMALSFAPAAFKRPFIAIRHPEVVSKSYPTYWDHLKAAGFHLEQTENTPESLGRHNKTA
jgi:3-phosphoshikimate 1-carboxyvinyltransferase